MRFTIEVRRGTDGRFEGVVEASQDAGAAPFSGVVELIGLLEARLDARPGAQDREFGAVSRRLRGPRAKTSEVDLDAGTSQSNVP